MLRPRMRLEGARELQNALRELPKRTGKRAVKRALLKASEPIAEDARGRAAAIKPRLAVAVRTADKLSRRQRRGRSKSANTVETYVGVTPGPLAHLIEFGTGPRWQKKTGRYTGAMPAFPFLRPAWESGKMQALKEFGRLLGIEIEKAAKRLARRRAKAGQ